MKEKRLTIYLLLLAVLLSQPISAMPQPTLVFATVDNFPPFSFISRGEPTGVDVEVVREMARRLGLRIEIETYPWVRVMEYVKDGTVDGGFAAFLTAQRKAFCLYTGVLHYEEFHVFVRKGEEFPFTGIADLYGKTVGKDIGVFVSQAFDQAVLEGNIRVENVNDLDLLNLKKLAMGRIDVMIGDSDVTTYHAKKLELGAGIVSLGPVHEKQAAYLVLSKQSDLPDKHVWQKKMISTLEQIRKDGTYQTLLDRYTAKK